MTTQLPTHTLATINLASVAEQTGVSSIWLQSQKTDILATRHNYTSYNSNEGSERCKSSYQLLLRKHACAEILYV